MATFRIATFWKGDGAVPNSPDVGVPLYNAPEIVENFPKVDMKIDIFSIGMIYFEM
ncbi:hypothetical protein A2U01_0061880, partial [Trifolium medium]|nr:hypothetical protein [Trifolium medium]